MVIRKPLLENSYDKVLITGTGARFIKQKNDFIFMDELEATANLIRACGGEEGIVINMGTGTSFLKYRSGHWTHLVGTGVGGGTLIGLAKRLLGTYNPIELEQLASSGDLRKMNLIAKDVYDKGLSWLHSDITISNFGNDSIDKADIHYMRERFSPTLLHKYLKEIKRKCLV